MTIDCLLPGPTLTEGVAEMLDAPDDQLERAGRDFIASERPTSLLERLAAPEEVANMSVYLASEQASATTGSALRVDGGVLRAAIG